MDELSSRSGCCSGNFKSQCCTRSARGSLQRHAAGMSRFDHGWQALAEFVKVLSQQSTPARLCLVPSRSCIAN